MELTPPYFSRRAQEERLTAEETSSSEARRAHLELAFRYEQVAVELHFGVAGSQTRGCSSPSGGQHSGRSYGRAEVGRAIRSAFPSPMSGAFPDLLDAIDEAERKITAAQD
jgi:hypothetical protein